MKLCLRNDKLGKIHLVASPITEFQFLVECWEVDCSITEDPAKKTLKTEFR